MAVGLLHLDQHALQQDGVVVLPVDREAVDVASTSSRSISRAPPLTRTVLSLPGIINSSPTLRVLGHVQVGLEEAVAATSGISR